MDDSADMSYDRQLTDIVARYDRIAPFYLVLEPLFLIFPRTRRKAISALQLTPGARVLEIGAGTGRNLKDLVEAVGPWGKVIAVDVSPGMLAQAHRLVQRREWSNVQLLQQDAAKLEVDGELDGVLFSLSYSVIPDPRAALETAWRQMRPSARAVVMDMGLANTALRILLRPIVRLLGPIATLLLGDPRSQPWHDLSAYAPVTTKRFLLNLYYICVIQKPAT
jgi:ubiquinone/menaquinone biosynthesis C-methylase UbiE